MFQKRRFNGIIVHLWRKVVLRNSKITVDFDTNTIYCDTLLNFFMIVGIVV